MPFVLKNLVLTILILYICCIGLEYTKAYRGKNHRQHLTDYVSSSAGYTRRPFWLLLKRQPALYFHHIRGGSALFKKFPYTDDEEKQHEIQGRAEMIQEFQRCEMYDYKAMECKRNQCNYCCSDQYCYPLNYNVADCFYGCGFCTSKDDCEGSGSCVYNSLAKQCRSSSVCKSFGSDIFLCRMNGCSFCGNEKLCGFGCVEAPPSPPPRPKPKPTKRPHEIWNCYYPDGTESFMSPHTSKIDCDWDAKMNGCGCSN